MNIDELLAQLRWHCSYVRLTEISGRAAIEADGVLLSFNEAQSLARGDTSLADIVSARKENPVLSPEEQIRRLAYALYIERGKQSGSELNDWLQAEEEIRRAEEEAADWAWRSW